jgi:hypothetical protein
MIKTITFTWIPHFVQRRPPSNSQRYCAFFFGRKFLLQHLESFDLLRSGSKLQQYAKRADQKQTSWAIKLTGDT